MPVPGPPPETPPPRREHIIRSPTKLTTPEPNEPPSVPLTSELPEAASEFVLPPPLPTPAKEVIEVTVGGDSITVQAPPSGPQFKRSSRSFRLPEGFLSLLANKSLILEVSIDQQGRATMLDAVEFPTGTSKSLQGRLREEARKFVERTIWEAARNLAGERISSIVRLRFTFS